MSEIVAIGQKDQVIGFQGVGVKVEPAPTYVEFAAKLKDACRRDEVGIILVTENYVMEQGAELIGILRKAYDKAILVIPDHHGSKGLAFRKMKADVKRALGVDMLSKID